MAGVGEIAPPFPSVEGKQGVWLLELDLGGKVERFATRVSVVQDETGDSIRFRAGLADMAIDLSDVESIAVQVDDKQTDWMLHIARGGQLHHRLARIYYWHEGQTLPQALLVIEGRTADIEAANPDAPSRLVFSVNGTSYDQSRLFPDAQAKVDGVTWSNVPPRIIDDTTQGVSYPWVIGFPGGGDSNTGTPAAAAPALMVEYNGTSGGPTGPQLVIGGEEWQATQVHLWAPTQTRSNGSDVRHADSDTFVSQDLLSRTVTMTDFPNSGSGRPLPELGSEFWVGYRSDWGGGLPNFDRTGTLRGLGEVIEWALETAEVEYDRRRVRAQADRLNLEFQIDTVISERIDLVDWLASQMASVFPIRELRSGRGLWYKLINWFATADDAVARLNVDDGKITRAAPYRIDQGRVANLFSIAYAPVEMKDPSRIRVLSSESDRLPGRGFLSPDTRVIGSTLLRRSQEIMARGSGRRRDGVIEAPLVQFNHTWSDSTAVNMARWWAQERALPLVRTSMLGADLEHIEPLDVVLLQDGASHIHDRVCLVDDVIIGGRLVQLDLTLLPLRVRSTE